MSVDRLEWIARARTGDREAFDVLAASIVDQMYSVARLVLRDADRAEDAVQEALVRCWRDLRALRDPSRFDAWMHRVLMHAVTEEFRRGGRYRASVSILRIEPSTSDASAAVVAREQLDRGFERLTLDHRAVIVLRLYLGLSLDETAAALGIPVGTAKSRLHYATEAMRVAIETDARPTAREVSA